MGLRVEDEWRERNLDLQLLFYSSEARLFRDDVANVGPLGGASRLDKGSVKVGRDRSFYVSVKVYVTSSETKQKS
jgi:hypothetical protein